MRAFHRDSMHQRQQQQQPLQPTASTTTAETANTAAIATIGAWSSSPPRRHRSEIEAGAETGEAPQDGEGDGAPATADSSTVMEAILLDVSAIRSVRDRSVAMAADVVGGGGGGGGGDRTTNNNTALGGGGGGTATSSIIDPSLVFVTADNSAATAFAAAIIPSSHSQHQQLNRHASDPSLNAAEGEDRRSHRHAQTSLAVGGAERSARPNRSLVSPELTPQKNEKGRGPQQHFVSANGGGAGQSDADGASLSPFAHRRRDYPAADAPSSGAAKGAREKVGRSLDYSNTAVSPPPVAEKVAVRHNGAAAEDEEAETGTSLTGASASTAQFVPANGGHTAPYPHVHDQQLHHRQQPPPHRNEPAAAHYRSSAPDRSHLLANDDYEHDGHFEASLDRYKYEDNATTNCVAQQQLYSTGGDNGERALWGNRDDADDDGYKVEMGYSRHEAPATTEGEHTYRQEGEWGGHHRHAAPLETTSDDINATAIMERLTMTAKRRAGTNLVRQPLSTSVGDNNHDQPRQQHNAYELPSLRPAEEEGRAAAAEYDNKHSTKARRSPDRSPRGGPLPPQQQQQRRARQPLTEENVYDTSIEDASFATAEGGNENEKGGDGMYGRSGREGGGGREGTATAAASAASYARLHSHDAQFRGHRGGGGGGGGGEEAYGREASGQGLTGTSPRRVTFQPPPPLPSSAKAGGGNGTVSPYRGANHSHQSVTAAAAGPIHIPTTGPIPNNNNRAAAPPIVGPSLYSRGASGTAHQSAAANNHQHQHQQILGEEGYAANEKYRQQLIAKIRDRQQREGVAAKLREKWEDPADRERRLRSASANSNNNTNNNNGPSTAEAFLERVKAKEEQSRRARLVAQHERERQEVAECTFSPQINKAPPNPNNTTAMGLGGGAEGGEWHHHHQQYRRDDGYANPSSSAERSAANRGSGGPSSSAGGDGSHLYLVKSTAAADAARAAASAQRRLLAERAQQKQQEMTDRIARNRAMAGALDINGRRNNEGAKASNEDDEDDDYGDAGGNSHDRVGPSADDNAHGTPTASSAAGTADYFSGGGGSASYHPHVNANADGRRRRPLHEGNVYDDDGASLLGTDEEGIDEDPRQPHHHHYGTAAADGPSPAPIKPHQHQSPPPALSPRDRSAQRQIPSTAAAGSKMKDRRGASPAGVPPRGGQTNKSTAYFGHDLGGRGSGGGPLSTTVDFDQMSGRYSVTSNDPNPLWGAAHRRQLRQQKGGSNLRLPRKGGSLARSESTAGGGWGDARSDASGSAAINCTFAPNIAPTSRAVYSGGARRVEGAMGTFERLYSRSSGFLAKNPQHAAILAQEEAERSEYRRIASTAAAAAAVAAATSASTGGGSSFAAPHQWGSTKGQRIVLASPSPAGTQTRSGVSPQRRPFHPDASLQSPSDAFEKGNMASGTLLSLRRHNNATATAAVDAANLLRSGAPDERWAAQFVAATAQLPPLLASELGALRSAMPSAVSDAAMVAANPNGFVAAPDANASAVNHTAVSVTTTAGGRKGLPPTATPQFPLPLADCSALTSHLPSSHPTQRLAARQEAAGLAMVVPPHFMGAFLSNVLFGGGGSDGTANAASNANNATSFSSAAAGIGAGGGFAGIVPVDSGEVFAGMALEAEEGRALAAAGYFLDPTEAEAALLARLSAETAADPDAAEEQKRREDERRAERNDHATLLDIFALCDGDAYYRNHMPAVIAPAEAPKPRRLFAKFTSHTDNPNDDFSSANVVALSNNTNASKAITNAGNGSNGGGAVAVDMAGFIKRQEAMQKTRERRLKDLAAKLAPTHTPRLSATTEALFARRQQREAAKKRRADGGEEEDATNSSGGESEKENERPPVDSPSDRRRQSPSSKSAKKQHEGPSSAVALVVDQSIGAVAKSRDGRMTFSSPQRLGTAFLSQFGRSHSAQPAPSSLNKGKATSSAAPTSDPMSAERRDRRQTYFARRSQSELAKPRQLPTQHYDANLTFCPVISEFAHTQATGYGHDRLHAEAKLREKRREKMQKDAIDREMATVATFKPKTNADVNTQRYSNVESLLNQRNLHSDVYKRHVERSRKVLEARKLVKDRAEDEEDLRECTFRPVINKAPAYIAAMSQGYAAMQHMQQYQQY